MRKGFSFVISINYTITKNEVFVLQVNTTMYAMAGLLIIAFFSNLFIKPVAAKHHVENTHPELKGK